MRCTFTAAAQPGRYYCPVCDPEQRFTVPVQFAVRTCGTRPASPRVHRASGTKPRPLEITLPPDQRTAAAAVARSLPAIAARHARDDDPPAEPARPWAEVHAYLSRCAACPEGRVGGDGRLACARLAGDCGCQPADRLAIRLVQPRHDCPLGRWGLYPAITTRHLLYHCCPLAANDGWRRNVARLAPHLAAFNGRRVVAIVEGEGLFPVADVAPHFPGCEILRLANDPELRETATLPVLLAAVADEDPHAATFFAHTKGNSTRQHKGGAARWRNMMYRVLLADWEQATAALSLWPAVGTTKMIWPDVTQPPYPSGLRHGRWMFAGTFFWFRHDRVFNLPNWRDVPRDRYGAEAWLSGLFAEPAMCHSLYQPWPEERYPTPSPYDPSLYREDRP